jgi:hypothetical protein
LDGVGVGKPKRRPQRQSLEVLYRASTKGVPSTVRASDSHSKNRFAGR